jgi:hypothetical protein
VPNDFAVAEGGEVLTITVTYDTLELYGKVVGVRQVRIEKP